MVRQRKARRVAMVLGVLCTLTLTGWLYQRQPARVMPPTAHAAEYDPEGCIWVRGSVYVETAGAYTEKPVACKLIFQESVCLRTQCTFGSPGD